MTEGDLFGPDKPVPSPEVMNEEVKRIYEAEGWEGARRWLEETLFTKLAVAHREMTTIVGGVVNVHEEDCPLGRDMRLMLTALGASTVAVRQFDEIRAAQNSRQFAVAFGILHRAIMVSTDIANEVEGDTDA